LAEDRVLWLPGDVAEVVEGEVGAELAPLLARREVLRLAQDVPGVLILSPNLGILSASEGPLSELSGWRGHRGHAVIGGDARRQICDGHKGTGGLGDATHRGETGARGRAFGAGVVQGQRGRWLLWHSGGRGRYVIVRP
jgi:hypothetical protein